MRPKRSKIEMYIDVLEVINRGVHKPTRIMHETNLSWRTFSVILESMLEQGLIKKGKSGIHPTYYVTEKGKNVVGHFKDLEEIVEIRCLET